MGTRLGEDAEQLKRGRWNSKMAPLPRFWGLHKCSAAHQLLGGHQWLDPPTFQPPLGLGLLRFLAQRGLKVCPPPRSQKEEKSVCFRTHLWLWFSPALAYREMRCP